MSSVLSKAEARARVRAITIEVDAKVRAGRGVDGLAGRWVDLPEPVCRLGGNGALAPDVFERFAVAAQWRRAAALIGPELREAGSDVLARGAVLDAALAELPAALSGAVRALAFDAVPLDAVPGPAARYADPKARRVASATLFAVAVTEIADALTLPNP